MSRGQILRLLCLMAFGFSALDLILGAADALIYHPSFGYAAGICFAVWILFTLKKTDRWLGVLLVLDLGLGALLFYGLGVAKLRALHFVFAGCWALLGTFFLRQKPITPVVHPE